MDTIFALSSGSPPAGIAVVRISGSKAGDALQSLAGRLPAPRMARVLDLRDARGDVLDRALVLWMPGPSTVTGEDIAELHLHGGRAVIDATERALSAMDGLRKAEPGEFTRRGFANGRMDLAEAEGLADLLAAETELQRRSAVAMAGGELSVCVAGWREQVLALSALVEAALDFEDEDDVVGLPNAFADECSKLSCELGAWLSRPRAEKLREGYRVVLAGPPNSGKSTLFNALIEDNAAIVTPMAGTTRDVLERSVAFAGVPFSFIDTAGLREQSEDSIELMGIDRARREAEKADLVLWLGPESDCPPGAWDLEVKSDLSKRGYKKSPRLRLSALTGEGVSELRDMLIRHAQHAMPAPGGVALNQRQHDLLEEAENALRAIDDISDPLLIGERLRQVRLAFDRLVGRTSTEDMLDALFGRFCIGK